MLIIAGVVCYGLNEEIKEIRRKEILHQEQEKAEKIRKEEEKIQKLAEEKKRRIENNFLKAKNQLDEKIQDYFSLIHKKAETLGYEKQDYSLYLTIDQDIFIDHLADQERVAASTGKLPYFMVVIDKINRGLHTWQEIIYLNDNDYEDSEGYVSVNYPEISAYSVKALMYHATFSSDNTAFHGLEKIVNWSEIFEISKPFPLNRELLSQNLSTAKIGHNIISKVALQEEFAILRDYLQKAAFTYFWNENTGGFSKAGWYKDNYGLLASNKEGTLCFGFYIKGGYRDYFQPLVKILADMNNNLKEEINDYIKKKQIYLEQN